MHLAIRLLGRNSTALNQPIAKSNVCLDQWGVQMGILLSIRLLVQKQLLYCSEKYNHAQEN